MRNLVYPQITEIDEYDLIAEAKQQPVRSSLVALRPQVNAHYGNYVTSFHTINALGDNPLNENTSVLLKNCYNNPTAALDSLKKRLVETQLDPFSSLCPYCLIHNHTTFDHYVPLEEYPAFSVLAKNLLPCCDLCNKKKHSYWRAGGQRAILHFYSDNIPQHRFLRCGLSYNELDFPVLNFSLRLSNIPSRVTIERHFERLKLLDRYNEEAPGAISDVLVDVKSLETFSPDVEQIRNVLTNKAMQLLNKCGNNYWYALCYETLASSERFIVDALEQP